MPAPTVPNTFRNAIDLGSKQRAVRNTARRDVWDLGQKSVTMPTEAINRRANEISAGIIRDVGGLKAQQRQLSAPKRLVSNVAQYPARWTVAGGTGAVGYNQIKKRKEVPYEETSTDPRFRPSYAVGLNPRSETYVRRGTAPGRYAATYGGNVAGGLVAPGIGQGIGATAGRNYNIQTDKVRAYRRSDKAQAKGWGGIAADAGGYYYGVQKMDAMGPFGVMRSNPVDAAPYMEIEKKRKTLADWSAEDAKASAQQRANIPHNKFPNRNFGPLDPSAVRNKYNYEERNTLPKYQGRKRPEGWTRPPGKELVPYGGGFDTRGGTSTPNPGRPAKTPSGLATTNGGVAPAGSAGVPTGTPGSASARAAEGASTARGGRLRGMFGGAARSAQHSARMNIGPAVGSDNPILAMARAQKKGPGSGLTHATPAPAGPSHTATVTDITPNRPTLNRGLAIEGPKPTVHTPVPPKPSAAPAAAQAASHLPGAAKVGGAAAAGAALLGGAALAGRATARGGSKSMLDTVKANKGLIAGTAGGAGVLGAGGTYMGTRKRS